LNRLLAPAAGMITAKWATAAFPKKATAVWFQRQL
jgi:hypothetical protein